MKHLFALPFVVVTWILSNGMLAQPTSGFVLETLDQPYEALMGAMELSPLYWDDYAGWDDPEFTIPLGFDFEFSITSFVVDTMGLWDVVLWRRGSRFLHVGTVFFARSSGLGGLGKCGE